MRVRAPMMNIHTHRGGRRLDHPLRSGRASRRSEVGGRESGPGELSARRAAGGHRRQRAARAHSAAIFPGGVRPARRSAAGSRGRRARRFAELAAAMSRATGAPITPEEVADGRTADRGRQHGQCGQAHLRGARLRRHALHPAVLRRRGRPARLPGGRCARHAADILPPARRRAVRVRHGPRAADRDALKRRSSSP